MSLTGNHSLLGHEGGNILPSVPAVSLPELRALPCGLPDDALTWIQNGDLTLLYSKQTGADVESLPGTIRSDNFAACSQIFHLKAAHINGFPAEWNADTSKFHLTRSSGTSPAVGSDNEQAGVAFTP